ncbi:hypothetical protein KC353_g16281, partial [Hortaea werneckii]
AASTFLDLLSIWGPLEQEVAAKSKFAKFHALRIAKAIKAGEDPNATNPVIEEPKQPEQPDEDGLEQELTDLEKQGAGAGAGAGAGGAQGGSAYQPPTVEDAPRSGVASRSESTAPNDRAAAVSPLDPVVAATGEDPIDNSGRQASIGGGYFPSVPSEPAGTPGRLDPDVDTAMTDPDRNFGGQDIAHEQPPASMQAAAAARGTPHDPADFYNNPTAPAPSTSIPTPPGAPSRPSRPPPEQMDALSPSQPPAGTYTPGSQAPPATFAPPSAPAPTISSGGPPPPPSAPAPSQPPPPPPTGGYRTDDDSVFQAQKHAKWAISALNFEDVETAVKELRGALGSLGAS